MYVSASLKEEFGIAILEAAVRPDTRLRLGTALAERSRRLGLTNEDIDALDQARDKTPAKPMSFE